MEASSNETIFGVVDHLAIITEAITNPPQLRGLSGGCFGTSQSIIGGSDFRVVEAGFGSFQLNVR